MAAFSPPAVSRRVPRVYQQSAAPTVPAPADLWIDRDTGYAYVRSPQGFWTPIQGLMIDPRGWGALLDGVNDDALAVKAAYDAAPAGSIILLRGDTWTFKTEVLLNRANMHVLIAKGTTVDCSLIANGTTTGVHDMLPVTCAFRVTGDRNHVQVDGLLQGVRSSSGDNTQKVAICAYGSSRTHVSGMGRIYFWHCGLWAGSSDGGVTPAFDFRARDVEVDACGHNIYIGFASQPGLQVDRWVLTDINSHDSVQDGLKLTSMSRDGQIKGGHYHHNTHDGIDWYVGGEHTEAIGVDCSDNGDHGHDIKYNDPVGGTGIYGYNQDILISGGRSNRNGIEGIAVSVGSIVTYPDGVRGIVIRDHEADGNTGAGFRLCLGPGSVFSGNKARGNGGGGIRFESGRAFAASDNHAIDNVGVGIYVAQMAGTGVANREFSLRDNQARDTRSGGARTQTYGFLVEYADGGRFTGNRGVNNLSGDWLHVLATARNVLGSDNEGTGMPARLGNLQTPTIHLAGPPVAGTNEVQTLTFGGTPTGGTFTLTLEGRVTAPITWSATNATLVANILAALGALPNIVAGDVTVAVGTAVAGIGTIVVTFITRTTSTMTAASSLTGTAPTLTVTKTTTGVDTTGRGYAGIGSLLVDTVNGKLYQNTAAATPTPVWQLVGTQS